MVNSTKRFKQLLAIVLVIVAVFIGYKIFVMTQFRVTSTDPATGSVSTISPYFRVYFSRNLSSKGLVINDPSHIDSGYTVNKNYVTIGFKGSLSQGQNYTLIIKRIEDSAGKTLTNLRFTFTPQNIGYGGLSKGQQKAVLKGQSQYESNNSSTNLVIVDSNSLINSGLSTPQLALLIQYLKEFNPTITSAAVSPTTVYPKQSANMDTINFNISINGTTYAALLSFTLPTNLNLTLTDPSNNSVVFDSASYSSPGGD